MTARPACFHVPYANSSRRSNGMRAALVALAFFGLGSPIGFSGCTSRPEPAAATLANRENLVPIRRVGMTSCVAAACHGGTGPEVGWSTAYTTWARSDPHSRAYEVLFDPRSDTMVERLNPGQPVPAERNPRCLACHANPGAVKALLGNDPSSLADAVDCETCHGPANAWLEPHKEPGWFQKTPVQSKSALGMTLTQDLSVRARLCAGCHVGEKGRDVNHDLIAAGHPRLNFELTTYFANVPRHWDEREELKRHPNREAAMWVLGRLASARASLELLEDRANAAKINRSHWPELSEYDCFSCHHDLTQPSWRQQRPSDDLPPGALRWGSWYWPMMGAIAKRSDGLDLEGPRSVLAALRAQICQPRPDPVAVASLAKQVIGQLDAALKQDPWTASSDKESIRKLLVQFATDGRALVAPGWDPAAQLYLALAALARSLEDRGGLLDQGTRSALDDLARELRLPAGYDSPRGSGPLIPGPFGEAINRVKPVER